MLGQPEVHEVHARLNALSARQRATIHEVMGDPTLLEALDDSDLRELVSAAVQLRAVAGPCS